MTEHLFSAHNSPGLDINIAKKNIRKGEREQGRKGGRERQRQRHRDTEARGYRIIQTAI